MESATTEKLERLEQQLAPYERMIRATFEIVARNDNTEHDELEVLVHQIILEKPTDISTITVRERFDGTTKEEALAAAEEYLAGRPEARER